MDEDLRVSASVVIPRHELVERFSRSSGPGGQGVNTTDSRVQLSFDLARSPSVPGYLRERALERLGSRLVDGCIVISASEHRSQMSNRESARARLALLLREAFAPGPRQRRPTKPTRSSQVRRLGDKKARGQVKRLRGRAGPDD